MIEHNIIELDDASFFDFVEGPGKKALEFYLPGCKPCKEVEILFKQLAPKYPEVRFARIDISKNEKAWEALGMGGLRVAPVTMFMNGKETEGKIGGLTKKDCIALLDKVQRGEINAAK